jgi:hypothetical protein
VAASVQPGPARVLFPARGFLGEFAWAEYDVSPDDRRFVFRRIVGSSQTAHAMTAVLVQHWLSDLRPVIPARD